MAEKDISQILLDKKEQIEEIDRKRQALVEKISSLRGRPCYPILSIDSDIGVDTVDTVYEELRKDTFKSTDKLDVLLDSSGGDIDSAYNIALLLRRVGKTKLTFIVPRWAKSAATLLACAGDDILMIPIAELGPIDPQITVFNPMENRFETFSPLHIESTLELIRNEYKKGEPRLAGKLLERLQFPLTLGSFKKSLEHGKNYVKKLLESRMLKGKPKKAEEIAKSLTEGYADHGYCLNLVELKELGLKAEELTGELLETVWEIHRLTKQRRTLSKELKKQEISDKLKNIPPELLESLPSEILEKVPVPTRSSVIDIMNEKTANIRTLSLRLAALLLLRDGKISIADIECLPFVEDRETANAIAKRLAELFNVENRQRKADDSIVSDWESILYLQPSQQVPNK